MTLNLHSCYKRQTLGHVVQNKMSWSWQVLWHAWDLVYGEDLNSKLVGFFVHILQQIGLQVVLLCVVVESLPSPDCCFVFTQVTCTKLQRKLIVSICFHYQSYQYLPAQERRIWLIHRWRGFSIYFPWFAFGAFLYATATWEAACTQCCPGQQNRGLENSSENPIFSDRTSMFTN